MKQKIRTNSMPYCILLPLLMVGMGLGIWMSCSKNDGVSSITPVSTKPSVADPESVEFHAKAGVNYDPFATMDLDGRKQAIGGPDVATEYLKLIVRHLANAMNDEKARPILHKVVPKWDKGEVKLAQIAIEHPDLLSALSKDFKRAIADRAIEGELSRQVQSSPFDGEALLKVSEALFDLVLTLVTPPNQGWSPSQAIPVFYMPVNDDEASVMEGVDAKLNTITFSLDSEETAFPFLILNFDEDSPLLNDNDKDIELPTSSQGLGIWNDILNSFSLTSPAYAHPDPYGHLPRYHTNVLQPVKEITIYNDHEPGWNRPEIKVTFVGPVRHGRWLSTRWSNFYGQTFDLRDVDRTNHKYTNYAHLRTQHGTCGLPVTSIRVWEEDVYFDDMVASWTYFYVGSWRELTPEMANSYDRDARLIIAQTSEYGGH